MFGESIISWLLDAGPKGLQERSLLLYAAGDPPPDMGDALAHTEERLTFRQALEEFEDMSTDCPHCSRDHEEPAEEPKTEVWAGDAPPELSEAQEFCGGYVEVLMTRDGDQMLVNEDGRGLGKLYNKEASALLDPAYSICGVCDVLGNALILKGESRWN